MAQPLPEGTCSFRRSVLNLHESGYDFDANDSNEFYTHVLVEIAWNQAWEYGKHQSQPDEGKVVHPRTYWTQANNPRPQQTSNEYLVWRHFCVEFKSDTSVLLSRYTTLNNGNMYRDRMDIGGTVKASFYPIKVPKGYRSMTLDLTSAVRAIYIPLSYQLSEEYPDWCTYAHVSFAARGGSDIPLCDFKNNIHKLHASDSLGLGIDYKTRLCVDLVGLLDYLSMNEYFRDENIKVYSNTYNDPSLSLIAWLDGLEGPDYQNYKDKGWIFCENEFSMGIGYDKVISANSGLSLQYVPTEQPHSWINSILSVAANVVGGFIPPVIAPLLHLAIEEAMLAMADPQAFLTQNPLDLATDVANAAVDTGQGAKQYADQKKLKAYEKGEKGKAPPVLLSPQYFPGRVKEAEAPSAS